MCQLNCPVERPIEWLVFLPLEGISNKCNFLDPSSAAVKPKGGLWVFGALQKVASTGTDCNRHPGVAAQGAFS